jgi:hypothetical protein
VVVSASAINAGKCKLSSTVPTCSITSFATQLESVTSLATTITGRYGSLDNGERGVYVDTMMDLRSTPSFRDVFGTGLHIFNNGRVADQRHQNPQRIPKPLRLNANQLLKHGGTILERVKDLILRYPTNNVLGAVYIIRP